MKFDQPASTNPIDEGRTIGRPTPRIDGRFKTTGTAPYAYERHDVAPNAAYGHVVTSGIAKGRLDAIDVAAARAAPGVLAVVTWQNAGKLGQAKTHHSRMLAGPEIQHYHQAIALVVAETFEQARAAARLVRVEVARETGRYDLAAQLGTAPLTGGDSGEGSGQGPVHRNGDFEGAFAAAPVKVDAWYSTADESHSMMEPHASVAAWQGDALTLWTSSQMVAWAVRDLAETLLIAAEKIRVVSPYTGGGFGAKLWIRSDAVLAALGARAAGRPVKVALARAQVPNNTVHRPATIQHVRLGAGRDGRMQAIAHESWSGNLPGGKPETATDQTRLLYASPNRLTAMRLATLDLPEGNSMRAPGEAPGMAALEIAIDELAEKLAIDPVELRILNDTQVDPEKPDRHFSQRNLIRCLRLGAERFGWSRRNPRPGATRDGAWLVGMGVAAAFRNNLLTKSAARVRLDGRGVVTVETDMTDIGTGSYTIIGMTAAEMMGVPLERVVVRLGDSAYPVSSGSGGQWGANNSTAGVYAACSKLREAAAQRLGLDPHDAVFADGHVRARERSVPLAQAAAGGELVAEDGIEYGDLAKRYQQSTFGAHFVEVGVDAYTGETRVRRMLAVCAAGRILNPISARSQVIGAMTMGVGAALMEHLAVDKRPDHGFFVNHDLASYEVPVHADIPHQDVLFLDEADPISSPMKAKGVAELGICGVAAAVANAVYNATGVRVREYPITLDKLLGKMADVA
jgi:xanthine dehydrogenase YagR molybdenum-binding subunit